VDGETSQPAHRDKTAMNGAQPSILATIEGIKIDERATCLKLLHGMVLS
jgi:hypothetical protein